MSITIKHWDGKTLYVAETASDVREALQQAVSGGAVLRGAVLRGAVLCGADLRGAVLCGAVLCGADLRDADLRGADLRDADLRDADLCGADLRDADLRGAVLRGADHFSSHPLYPVRLDFWAVLDAAPAEVAALRDALVGGKVDGSTYEGECACLVGTIANVRGVGYRHTGITPNAYRPAERWFAPINKGDAPGDEPENEGQFRAGVAVRWIDEWMASRQLLVKAFGAPVA